MAWSEWKKFNNHYHNVISNYDNQTKTTSEMKLTDTYTVESDCKLSITQIAHLFYTPSKNLVEVKLSKNNENIEPTIIYGNHYYIIANTLVECKKGDIIDATCIVGSTSGSFIKSAYIEFNIVG